MASDASIAACGAASLALWIIVDRLQWGRGVQFDAFGIPMLALIALLVLALAYLTARLSNPPQPIRCTLLMAMASLPLWIALSALIDAYVADRWSTLAWVIFGTGVLLYAARSLRALSGRLQFPALGARAALLAGYLWLGQLIDLHPTLWAPPDNVDEPDSTMSAQVAESLLFVQRDRIDEALEAVADSDSDNGSAVPVSMPAAAGRRYTLSALRAWPRRKCLPRRSSWRRTSSAGASTAPRDSCC